MTSNYGVGHESAENYFKEIIHKIEPQEIEDTRTFIKKN
jgi:predicted solute-binding protein